MSVKPLGTAFFGLLLMSVLAGCASKEIKPEPLQGYYEEFAVKRDWHRYTGLGSSHRKFLDLQLATTEQAVFIADYQGRLRALKRNNGRTLWRNNLQVRASSGLRAGYGLLFFGTRDAQAFAVDQETGEVRWQVRVSSEVLSRPDTNGELVIFQTLDGRVIALDVTDGSQRWSFEVPVPVLSLRGNAEPLIVRDRVYAGFANGRVAALDIETGTPVWERRVAEPSGRSELDRIVDIDGNLIVEGGGVFAATFQGAAMVMDEEDGRPYWDRALSTANKMTSYRGTLFIADEHGVVWALDMRSGNPQWQFEELKARRLTGVALHQGLIVVGDYQGYLHWIDPERGTIVARRRHDADGFAATPVVHGDNLYALSRDGEVASYRLKPHGK